MKSHFCERDFYHKRMINMTNINSAKKKISIFFVTCLFVFSTSSAKESNPKEVTRSSGIYSATIELSPSGVISSVFIKHGKKQYTIPKGLYKDYKNEDLKNPHLGKGFDPEDFRLEITKSKIFVRIKTGDRVNPQDHFWMMPLPLKTVSRISRKLGTTGYSQVHSSRALESKVASVK